MLRKKVEYEVDENGCWICTSHKPHKSGYPRIKENRVQIYLHRYVYKQYFGEIPTGFVVRHMCDNRMCINPSHLEIGTIADNNRDTFIRGRHARGERHGNAKLNESSVRDIRESQLTDSQLARLYNVCRRTISRVRKVEIWRHVS